MNVRSFLTTERAVLVVLGVGFGSFTIIHSAALLQASGEQTLSLVRGLWLFGFLAVLTLIAILYYNAR